MLFDLSKFQECQSFIQAHNSKRLENNCSLAPTLLQATHPSFLPFPLPASHRQLSHSLDKTFAVKNLKMFHMK